MGNSRVLLVLAIVLASVAEALGILAVLAIVLPGPFGEWAEHGKLATWAVVAPIGLLTLVAAWRLKSGPPGMRQVCVIISILCLVLPVVATVAWNMQRT